LIDQEHREKILRRLRRIEGQVRGLARMIEEDRSCHEVLTLLAGIRGALGAVGEEVLESYLVECQARWAAGEDPSREMMEALHLLRQH
jgi:DNA-binding FrmR family transcriptional regulator